MRTDAKLLIVDDEPDHRRFAKAVLASRGWIVDEAQSGAAALRMIAANGYSLVLLDVRVPELHGLTIARAIRESGEHALPIIAVTTLDGQEWMDRIDEAGMDGRIGKPCSPEALVAAASPWWPDEGESDRRRLEALFGHQQYSALIASFRAELAAALAGIEADDARSRAHRIGGLAGTLGFSRVSEPWIALSEGNDSAIGEARRSARKALLAMGRETSNWRRD